jgi:hypothetical protein
MTETSSLADRTWDYLTRGDGDTALRMRVAKDLAARQLFLPDRTDEQARVIIEQYLTLNPLNACDAGIERFRDALLTEPGKTIDLVLTIRYEGPTIQNGGPLTRALQGFEFDGRKIVEVGWNDLRQSNEKTKTYSEPIYALRPHRS